jgi:hypothetical protein
MPQLFLDRNHGFGAVLPEVYPDPSLLGRVLVRVPDEVGDDGDDLLDPDGAAERTSDQADGPRGPLIRTVG